MVQMRAASSSISGKVRAGLVTALSLATAREMVVSSESYTVDPYATLLASTKTCSGYPLTTAKVATVEVETCHLFLVLAEESIS